MFPNQSIYCLEKIIHIIRIIREEVTISIHLLVGQKRYTKHLAFIEFILWNHISSTIQTDVSYTSFKCIVKTYIQNNNITIFRLNF